MPMKVSINVPKITATLSNMSIYNDEHNILRIFDTILNFIFSTSKTKRDYQ